LRELVKKSDEQSLSEFFAMTNIRPSETQRLVLD